MNLDHEQSVRWILEHFYKPPQLLQVGDVVETGVENIGVMRNKVASPPPSL